jgi:hypothetical protein
VLDEIRMASRSPAALDWVERLHEAGDLHIPAVDDTFEPPIIIGLPPVVADGPPALQGPFAVLGGGEPSRTFLGGVGMKTLAVLPRAAPTVLLTVDAHGRVSVLALVEQIQPAWGGGGGGR